MIKASNRFVALTRDRKRHDPNYSYVAALATAGYKLIKESMSVQEQKILALVQRQYATETGYDQTRTFESVAWII
jgi:hypothetical protein